jgi:DNA-binding MarR family transcriptional regulator
MERLTDIVISVIVMIMTMVRERERIEAEPSIRRVPLALARRFFQVCNTAGAEAVAADGLTPLEFAVLAYVNSIDGEPDIDQSSLAVRLGVDRNTTSLLVRALERRRLLEQRVNESDRRARLLRLTPAGEDLFARLHPRALDAQFALLTVLETEERELFLDLLTKVIEENRHLAKPGGGRRKRSTARRHPPRRQVA